MRQAIVTKFLSPTDVRGSRVKATCSAGSVTMDWAHAWNAEENHQNAAEVLRDRQGWAGRLIGGGLPSGDMVWVFEE